VSGNSAGFNACGSPTTGTFATSSSTTTLATNLAAAINACPVAAGVSATSSGAVVTITARTAGSGGNSITTASSLPVFTWTNPTLVGGITPYCNAAAPSVMWAYNATTTPILTSPSLSLDGTKVVFVEQGTAGATMHVLKWKQSQGTASAPVAVNVSVNSTDTGAATTWATCLADVTKSCMFNVKFGNLKNDTNSSPFYTYDGIDALYVGDDNGSLHKFTGIFYGTPAEVTSAPWPITVHSTYQLTSPVRDFTSNNIFVGDSNGQLSYVMETGSAVGTCGTGSAPCLGSPTQALGSAIVDPPIVDATSQKVFAFEGNDFTNHGMVYQFNTALANSSKLTAIIGAGAMSSHSNIRAGTFDNAYFNSADSTGNLYVCGKHFSFQDRAALYKIPITAGAMGSPTSGDLQLVSTSYAECSPVTEVYNSNTGTDWLFFSVGNYANQTNCGTTAGCLMSLNLTAVTSWPPSAITAGYPTPIGPSLTGGLYGASTSGIVMDNDQPQGQASSIYFTTESATTCGTPEPAGNHTGCAVKLTQSGLQ
jgi:hypothetical protein